MKKNHHSVIPSDIMKAGEKLRGKSMDLELSCQVPLPGSNLDSCFCWLSVGTLHGEAGEEIRV